MGTLSIKDYIDGHIQTITGIYFGDERREAIQAAAGLMVESFKSGGKLLICGNGGSAADSQHLAAEFVPMGLPAIALTTDTSFLTAWSNDREFPSVFSQQIQTLGKPGDLLLGITTSGTSLNVINAFYKAQFMGLKSIALTGRNGLNLLARAIPTVTIAVPSTNTQHVQEAHIMVYHLLWLLVKEGMAS